MGATPMFERRHGEVRRNHKGPNSKLLSEYKSLILAKDLTEYKPLTEDLRLSVDIMRESSTDAFAKHRHLTPTHLTENYLSSKTHDINHIEGVVHRLAFKADGLVERLRYMLNMKKRNTTLDDDFKQVCIINIYSQTCVKQPLKGSKKVAAYGKWLLSAGEYQYKLKFGHILYGCLRLVGCLIKVTANTGLTV